MLVLVDYDNVALSISRLGIVHLAERIVSKIDVSEIDSNRRVYIRLYGGWYEHARSTQRAQQLSTEVLRDFPTTALISDGLNRVVVNCEMAYSLMSDPSNHLFHTFRSRGIPSNLRVRHPSSLGCNIQGCPISHAFEFVSRDVCTACNSIRPADIFFRGEQKLVDTMLTSDLIFSANQNMYLGVVSSDDDFWPGIKTTLALGGKIIQMHTKNRSTPVYYTRTTTSNYIQKTL